MRDITGAVAFTPHEAEAVMRALAPPTLRLVPQRGADLGERLSNILTDLLNSDHAGAIAVDSDSPTLPMAYLAEAATVLSGATYDVVLGPCEVAGITSWGCGAHSLRSSREFRGVRMPCSP
jgi:uncharacterized protein